MARQAFCRFASMQETLHIRCRNAAKQYSPGYRPGPIAQEILSALKGLHNLRGENALNGWMNVEFAGTNEKSMVPGIGVKSAGYSGAQIQILT